MLDPDIHNVLSIDSVDATDEEPEAPFSWIRLQALKLAVKNIPGGYGAKSTLAMADKFLEWIMTPNMQLDSAMVSHARSELEIMGVDREDTEGVLGVMQAFANMRLAGGGATFFIPLIYKLLQFQNITPLTNSPDEWMQVSDEDGGIWQSCRNSEAFSNNGGRTYYLLSEAEAPSEDDDEGSVTTYPIHETLRVYIQGGDNGNPEPPQSE